MDQKKRFILELPYFLATEAGSLKIRALFASCYAVLAISYLFPFFGVFIALGYCLTVWQLVGAKLAVESKYLNYNSFLLQRTIFSGVFAFGLFIFCAKSGTFNIDLWLICVSVLAFINFSDIFFTLKGFTGIAYINGKKN